MLPPRELNNQETWLWTWYPKTARSIPTRFRFSCLWCMPDPPVCEHHSILFQLKISRHVKRKWKKSMKFKFYKQNLFQYLICRPTLYPIAWNEILKSRKVYKTTYGILLDTSKRVFTPCTQVLFGQACAAENFWKWIHIFNRTLLTVDRQ